MEEAHWEAKLRQLARRETRHVAPVSRPAIAKRSSLKLVTAITRHDALLLPRSWPLLTGSEAEDLACGQCSNVIGAGITAAAARSQFPEGERVIVRCRCGAFNLLCHAPGGRSEPHRARAIVPARPRPRYAIRRRSVSS